MDRIPVKFLPFSQLVVVTRWTWLILPLGFLFLSSLSSEHDDNSLLFCEIDYIDSEVEGDKFLFTPSLLAGSYFYKAKDFLLPHNQSSHSYGIRPSAKEIARYLLFHQWKIAC